MGTPLTEIRDNWCFSSQTSSYCDHGSRPIETCQLFEGEKSNRVQTAILNAGEQNTRTFIDHCIAKRCQDIIIYITTMYV